MCFNIDTYLFEDDDQFVEQNRDFLRKTLLLLYFMLFIYFVLFVYIYKYIF
jgi:hypothetical protein